MFHVSRTIKIHSYQHFDTFLALLELVGPSHVGNLPVVVVSEVVVGAGALVHQIVGPLPRPEISEYMTMLIFRYRNIHKRIRNYTVEKVFGLI